MKWIEITKATGALRDYAKNARNEVVVVTKRGKPVAAIVDVSEYDRESLSLSTNEKFLDILARSRARMEKEGTISADEVRRRFGIPERKRRNTKRGVKSAA